MASQTIWGSTDRGPATGTMRFPVDTSSSSTPGYITVAQMATYAWTSPTLVTPNIGVATATSVNKIIITAPASGATLTIADGATLSAPSSATVSGTNTGDQTDATLTFTDITTNNSSTAKHGFLKKLNNDATYYMDGTGNWSVPAGGGGSGTVNSGTIGQLTWYASTGAAVSGNANATISSGALTLGQTGSVIGTLVLSGNTSGAVTIIPQAAAGTWNFNLPTTAGTAGQVLTSQGGGSNAMTWTNAGTGTVTGPGSSTDTALARWNGTGGTAVQNTGILVDGSNNMSGIGTILTAAHTITSSSATALAVGANGTTNPSLQVDASTASAANGLKITSTAAGSGVTLGVISGGSNDSLTVSAKGSGSVSFITTTGSVLFRPNGNTVSTYTQNTMTFSPVAAATGSATPFTFTSPASTAQTAATNRTIASFNMSATIQHASNTTVSLDTGVNLAAPTVAFASATGTVTDAATLYINGPWTAGTNAAITNSHAILIPTLALSGVTNAYGLTVAAPSGATNNYAAQFTGKVGISTAAPTAALHLPASTTSAGTAPLKIASGTVMTTAETGAIEYNGTNLFFTRSGTTREGVLTQSAVTTETLVSDTSVTVNIGGVTYKLLARA